LAVTILLQKNSISQTGKSERFLASEISLCVHGVLPNGELLDHEELLLTRDLDSILVLGEFNSVLGGLFLFG